MEFLEKVVYTVILRTYYYLEQTGREDSFARFPYLRVLVERLAEETAEQSANQEHRKEIQVDRYRNLLDAAGDGLEGDHVIQTVLDLSLAVMQVPEYAAYLNYYTGNMVTIQLAYELEGIVYPDYTDVTEKLRCLQNICQVDWKKSLCHYAPIEGGSRLLAYLMGNDSMDAALKGKAEWFSWQTKLHPMYIRQEMAEEGAAYMRKGSTVLLISGEGGRRFLAKHIAQRLERDLLFVNTGSVPAVCLPEFEDFRMHLVREAFLRGGAVCFYGMTAQLQKELQAEEAVFWEAFVQPFCEAEISVILCTDQKMYFRCPDQSLVNGMKLMETTRAEREQVWRGFRELYGLEVDCVGCSVRFRLLASEIAKSVELWRYTKGTGTDETELSRICYDMLCAGTEDAAGTVSYPSVGLADLKVSVQIQEVLGQICCGVRAGYQIFEEWNLKQQYPYGRAITVLLTGPPGTGKTMTAHVIAKELGVPLYQVDLSHIMDKYIGETEKHLEQVFAFAEKTNMVLFFDEADSLFGKRGEVTEGKDRYANMEVSYILQRIEQFEGIAVMATNFYNNIDKAFLRRMKYVLKYQLPGEAIRHSIWESCLPPELPREELDLGYLARQFEFTGGMIKNVVLHACVMAVYEDCRLNMGHVLRAVQAELEKMERTVPKEIWGEYGDLME